MHWLTSFSQVLHCLEHNFINYSFPLIEKVTVFLPLEIISHYGIILKGFEQVRQLSSDFSQVLQRGLHYTHC